MASICMRSLLTLLHGVIGVAAGFFCLYTLFSWNTPPTCLPTLLERSGSSVPFQNGLPILCESLVYGMGALCLLNFIMCIINNCLHESSCVAFFHMMLTTVYMAYSVMGGSVVTVYYIVWCDMLQQVVPSTSGCDQAAAIYDTYNTTAYMTSHKSRMVIQMASLWSMFPIACFALLTYVLIFRDFATEDNRDEQIRYVIMQHEGTPLLTPVNRPMYARRNSIGEHSQRAAQIESTSQSTS